MAVGGNRWHRGEVLNKTLTDRAGNTVTGSSTVNCSAVDAGVQWSHPPEVGMSGDSNESVVGEERNRIV